MKILKLRFKNLNSLAGEWEIDFSSPQFISEGIFAITGPTGAGKSTILDAICLGLYGKTPRLNNISQSTNEIMSRKTGSCFAEVLFESQKGVFRTHWSQKRARENANGRLQAPQFEIADASTGNVIESQISKTTKAIEERTGMDFGRFTQAMMLAQGSFAAFLQASEHDRAAMLEDITGTEIYSELSKLAFERNKAEKEKLRDLQMMAEGVKTLNDEEIALLENENINNQQLIDEKNNLNKKNNVEITWLKQLNSLTTEIEALYKAKHTNNEAILAFEPQEIRLNNALKANELEANYVAIANERKKLRETAEAIEKIERALPQLQKSCTDAEQQKLETKQKLDAAELSAESERELIKNIRKMDVLIGAKKDAKNALIKKLNEANKLKGNISAQIKSIEKYIENANLQLLTSSQYLHNNKADEHLAEEAPALKSDILSINEKAEKLRKLEADIKILIDKKVKKQKESNDKSEKITDLDKENKTLILKIEQKQTEHETLLNNRSTDDYRREQELLNEKLLLEQKIESYEAERQHLEDGKACPLCGSEHHPFALGNIPPSNVTKLRIQQINDLLKKVENGETEKRKIELELQNRKIVLNNANAELNVILAEIENVSANLKDKNSEREDIKTAYENLLNVLKTNLEKYSFENGSNWLEVREQIDKRIANWKIHKENKERIDKEIVQYENDKKTQLALFEKVEETHDALEKEVKKHNDDYEKFVELRKKDFGIKDTDEEEKKLDTKLKQLREAMELAQIEHQKAENLYNSNVQKRDEMQAICKNLVPTLAQLEAEFTTKLAQSNFVNENQFVAARMSLDERNMLKTKSEKLRNEALSIKARLDETEKKLEAETEKQLTTETIDELLLHTSRFSTEINALTERNGAIRKELENDNNSKAQHAKLLIQIELQQNEQQKWAQLDSYIGSADGQKFRRFAQGLTFEIMVRYANVQLGKLTDRYMLVRSIESPLSLTVIDHYQAGEQRTTKNLSGGECFLVSLSLALGLSQMASKNVRIDSLFLDEGFGTLDEETLETALNTLASMQQDGKLIGVISHISQLKDRINTKISVEKSSNGRSTLSGPGCRSLG